MQRIVSFTAEYSVRDVIQALEDNLSRHKEEYVKAWLGYHRELVDRLNVKADLVSGMDELGRDELDPEEASTLPKPETFFSNDDDNEPPVYCGDQYAKMITMFQSVKGADVELNSSDANSIFNDDWDWRMEAMLSNSKYFK